MSNNTELFSMNFFEVADEDDLSVSSSIFDDDHQHHIEMDIPLSRGEPQQQINSAPSLMVEPLPLPSVFSKQGNSSSKTVSTHSGSDSTDFLQPEQPGTKVLRNSFLFQDMMREIAPSSTYDRTGNASVSSLSSVASDNSSRASGGVLNREGSSTSIEAMLGRKATKSLKKSSSGRSLISACEAKRRNRLAKKQFQSETALAIRKRQQRGMRSTSSNSVDRLSNANSLWGSQVTNQRPMSNGNASFSNFQF